jgi:hypothetical protein
MMKLLSSTLLLLNALTVTSQRTTAATNQRRQFIRQLNEIETPTLTSLPLPEDASRPEHLLKSLSLSIELGEPALFAGDKSGKSSKATKTLKEPMTKSGKADAKAHKVDEEDLALASKATKTHKGKSFKGGDTSSPVAVIVGTSAPTVTSVVETEAPVATIVTESPVAVVVTESPVAVVVTDSPVATVITDSPVEAVVTDAPVATPVETSAPTTTSVEETSAPTTNTTIPPVSGSCLCSPISYTFKLSLSQTCNDNDIQSNPGIANTFCLTDDLFDNLPVIVPENITRMSITDFAPKDVADVDAIFSYEDIVAILTSPPDDLIYTSSVDLVPVTIGSVTFVEFDTSGNLSTINQDFQYSVSDFADGDTITYNSILSTLDPALPVEEQMDKIPGGVALLFLGANAEGNLMRSRVAWSFEDMMCSGGDVGPINVGDKIGWITMVSLNIWHHRQCDTIYCRLSTHLRLFSFCN